MPRPPLYSLEEDAVPPTRKRLLSVHEAKINTAGIEVKTLTIKGRQLTLSVFRQLEEASILGEFDTEFSGTPWGRVNYFWKKGTDNETHMQIVWQCGDELRRDCMERDTTDLVDRAVRELVGYNLAHSVENILFGQLALKYPKEIRAAPDGYSLMGHYYGKSGDDKVLDGPLYKLFECACSRWNSVQGWMLDNLKREVDELVKSVGGLTVINNYLLKKDGLKKEYEKRLGELESLPQLFIAV